jgi:hypothetical protein
MAEAVHMSLRDRKAYALLSLYLQVVRTVVPEANSEDLEVIQESVGTLARDVADETFTGKPQKPLDLFLVDAIDDLENLVATRLRSNGMPPATRRVLDALKRDAGKFRCADCTKDPICNGSDADDAIVGAEDGGRCIEAIKTAISDARRITYAEYFKHAGPVPFPSLVFSTEASDEPLGAIPVRGIAINGMTSYDDNDNGKVSEIEVRMAPTALSRVSVGALPYLLLHEVFCHGYQMVDLEGSRPNRGESPDPLSEGMADVAAIRLLEKETAGRGKREPLHEANLEIARMLHKARRNLDLEPRFPEAPWVAQGAAAAEAVERLYLQDTTIAGASEDTLALTISLNAAGWGFTPRFKGLSKLLQGLGMPKDLYLVELLLEFRTQRNVKDLVDYLTK